MILFDFKAAFPSKSHDYLLGALGRIGFPQHCTHFIEALYDNNYCRIACKGGLFEGFDITSGI
eukprot:2228394-Heterocapsa_arctica.AAC.1